MTDRAPFDDPLPLAMPRVPGESVPYSFPLLATLAPVIGSGAIWAMTQSPFALVFAVLGPVIAVASLADARVQGRRRRRSERRRFEADAAATLESIAVRHEAERTRMRAAHPGIHQVIAGTGPPGESPPDAVAVARSDHGRWTRTLSAPVPLALGRGDVRSELRLDGHGSSADTRDPDVVGQLDEIRSAAARLPDAPVVVDARVGIGVFGPPGQSRAAARAMLLRLARALGPADTTIRATDAPALAWVDRLPHRVQREPADPPEERGASERVEFLAASGQAESTIVIAVAERAEDLPRRCGVIVAVRRGAPATLSERDGAGAETTVREVRLDYASRDAATGYAAALTACAAAEGLTPEGAALPTRVALSALPAMPDPPTGATTTLRCPVGADGRGTWHLDLVRDGPHAVIGGTTGSGKSELLVAWVLSMATAFSPAQVTFLLVDFKGGASFSAVQNLPHVVGLITDLDPRTARRALESLRAEVRHRERALLAARAKGIEQLPDGALPRLVIVVDEFAALGTDFPELHALFADLASRGRSLGIHLVLCTQRPADSLRDAILANCTLRISLRVNSPADSSALIGTAAAAQLPRDPRGRALVAPAGEAPNTVQVAIADADDPVRVRARWAMDAAGRPWPQVRRPWCEPLPAMLPLPALRARPRSPEPGIVFALADRPNEQRQDVVAFAPRHGNLLVLGAHGAGKTATLRALADGAGSDVGRVPQDVEGAWDAVLAAAESGPGRRRLVVVDDVDALVTRFGRDHQLEFVDLLAGVLRDGPRTGIGVVLSAQRVTALVQPIAALCDSSLILRLANRQDHLVAGGRGDDYDPDLPPGGGFWRSDRIQVGFAAPATRPPLERQQPHPISFPAGGRSAIVSRAPTRLAAALEGWAADGTLAAPAGIRVTGIGAVSGGLSVEPAHAVTHEILLGDPESWQSAWAMLAEARASMPLVFEGCSAADFRAVSGDRRLPPPLAPGSVWVLSPHGDVHRARLGTPR